MKADLNIFQAEDKFYSEPFYLSYSGLNKLLFSPRVFYNQYILKQKEEKLDTHLIEGKLVHMLLLEPEEFNKFFIISPSKLPSDANKIILDRVYTAAILADRLESTLDDFQEVILTLMQEMNHYQSLKDDVGRLSKMLVDENYAYYSFLQRCTGKTLIDQTTYEKCLDYVEEMTSNPDIRNALHMDSDLEIFNEHYLSCHMDKTSKLYLKGFLDRMVIDKINKIVYVPDVKTTAKPIDRFPEAIEHFRYNNQAAIYTRLVKAQLKDPEWTVKFCFVVVDGFKQNYVYDVSEKTMKYWDDLLQNDLDAFKYHYVNKNFTLPFELLKRRIIL